MSHASDFLAELQGNINAKSEAIAEVMAALQPEPHELEIERQQVEELLEHAFSASWTPERQGLTLTTDFSERLKATSGDEENRMRIHVSDMSFDPDARVYSVQLMGAAIRAIAEALSDHSADAHPSVEFLTCAVDLTRHIQQRTDIGRIPGRFILDCEKFGLSSFDEYLSASVAAEPGATFPCDLDAWSPCVNTVIEAQFISDGGPMALVSNEELREGLTAAEHNQIGQLEASGTDCRDQVNQILASAAHRLTAVAQ